VDKWVWIAAALSLGLSFTPWGQEALYPFKLFTTWVHECGHAVMTVLLGGSVASITIEPNTSGLTRSLVPAGRLSQGLVASAGYLGASVVGCVLLTAARVQKWARPLLFAVGAFMLLTLVLWIRNLFGFAVVLAWGVVLVWLGRSGTGKVPRFVLSLLAIQVALNAVYDIRVLFLVNGPSDAETMARLFVLPAWLWASAWMVISGALLLWTLGIARGRRARK
jgi:Peptidase M50B-like